LIENRDEIPLEFSYLFWHILFLYFREINCYE